VHKLICDNLYLLWVVEYPDVVNGILTNTFTPLARQKVALICNFISFYVIMVPFTLLFVFKLNMGVGGIYKGTLIGALS